MINLSSKTATVLVIFIVAVLAFCMASVFASITGPISIIPNQTASQDNNLSNITSNLGLDNSNSYKSTNDNSKSYSKDTSDDSSKVETTTDKSSDSSSSSSSHSSSSKDSSSKDTSGSSSKDSSSSGGSSESKSSNVETTKG